KKRIVHFVSEFSQLEGWTFACIGLWRSIINGISFYRCQPTPLRNQPLKGYTRVSIRSEIPLCIAILYRYRKHHPKLISDVLQFVLVGPGLILPVGRGKHIELTCQSYLAGNVPINPTTELKAQPKLIII